MDTTQSVVAGRTRPAMFVIVALTALIAVSLTGFAGPASAEPGATSVKKCKKGFKKIKGKCKKKKKAKAPAAPALPAPGPQKRISITWTTPLDIDLLVIDAAGNVAGPSGIPGVTSIPNSTFSGDITNGGTESFTDNAFVKGGSSNREFKYLVCGHTTTRIVVKVELTTSSGAPVTMYTLNDVDHPFGIGDLGDAGCP
jgi:hypothetical protein